MNSNKIRVLHINTLDSLGGASQVAMDLIHHLDAECCLAVKTKTSHDSKVIQLKKNLFDYFLMIFEKIWWKLGGQPYFRAVISLDNETNFTYNKLRKLKEYREADIIHLHNLHGGYFDFSTLGKIAKEKKIVWTLHDMWAITGGDAYTFENDNYKRGIGYTPYLNHYPVLNPVFDRRQYFIEKKKKIYAGLQDAITIVPVSNWLYQCIKEAYVYNPSMRLRKIHNGIDTAVFRNQHLRNWKKPRILFFNMNNLFKGDHLFINILEKIEKEFDLYVVGKKLKRNSRYKHFQYISDRTVLSELYNQADILVFPSLAENFPLTILEAMSCGVCVVSSDAGGITELINNEVGFVFENNNKENLLLKVNQALSDLEGVRKKGLAAEKSVLSKFTVENTCSQYLDLYREILDEEMFERLLLR